jgi:small subunit ribosomal protein S3
MGHKVHPNGFRLGITAQWTSNWYAERGAYRENLNKDMGVRSFLREKLAQASVSRVQIDRPAKSARVTIHTARPGIVIGKKGEDIEKLRREVAAKIGLKSENVHISVEEIRKPELDSQLIADSVAQQLERRIMFRRAMKRAVTNAMRLGAGGIKIQVGGRLNGAEIARVEWYREGRVPLHTLRAYVDYGFAEAKTTYGVIGVKVWVFSGEAFEADKKDEAPAATPGEAAA